jgi:hypothetical protein
MRSNRGSFNNAVRILRAHNKRVVVRIPQTDKGGLIILEESRPSTETVRQHLTTLQNALPPKERDLIRSILEKSYGGEKPRSR